MDKQETISVTGSAPLIPRGVLQRKCDCGNHTVAGGECAECAKKKDGLQRKLAIGASNDPFEQEADRIANHVITAPAHHAVSVAPPRIQPYAMQETTGRDTAPAIVDHVLASSGKPLEPALRQDMEQRFGHDFSRVRVHSDGVAGQSAREVNARAYTMGRDIVFGPGQFDPGGYEGRKLIAHELTHVVQQSGGSSPVVQRTPDTPENPAKRRPGSTLPYREAKNLAECIRIMGPQSTDYCRREVLGEDESTSPVPAQAPTSAVTFGSGKTGRVLRMESLRDCAFTITYANPREVDCKTAWQNEKGAPPPGPLCGTSLVYDIVSVSAKGGKCPPKLEGLKVSENTKGDHGCTPTNFVWPQGSCVIGPGGKVSNCTDTFTLCGLTSALKGDCTEIVDQEMEVGGQLAEEHEITFELKKSATDCKGKVTRN